MLAGTALSGASSSGGASAANTLHATLLSAVPYAAAAVAMWAVAWLSSRNGEKDLHISAPWLVGGLLLALFSPLYKASFGAGVAVIVAALACAYSSQSVAFARVTEALDTRHAGVGVAVFNAVGAAGGGAVGTYTVGALVQRTGSIQSSMIFMGAFLFAAGAMMGGLGLLEYARRRRGRPPLVRRSKSSVTAAAAAGGGGGVDATKTADAA